MRLAALQPLKLHYFWGRCIAWLVSGPIHYRRDLVMMNLARSFPEKKYKELKVIMKDFYRHFGDIVAETFWFAGAHDKKRLKNPIFARRKTKKCSIVCFVNVPESSS